MQLVDSCIVNMFCISDNSGESVTYWLKPSVKDDGVKLTLGNHSFSYVAVDSFQNRAKCSFVITVSDITPPTIDDCIDPLEFYVPLTSNLYDNRSHIEWDPPIIYDNSELEVNVSQSIMPGALGLGDHSVKYTAIDSSGNQNVCIINVTVKAMQCAALAAPLNGHILCAQNISHTWCDATCDIGYMIYHNDIESLRLWCDHSNPRWQYDPLPDCTRIELPESVEQMVTLSLYDDIDICQYPDESGTALMQDALVAQIKRQLCDQSVDTSCQVLSEMPSCDAIDRSSSDDETSNRNFYRTVKRAANRLSAIPRKQVNLKFKVYVRVSKGLGLWNSSLSRAENIEIVKSELGTYHNNENLRDRLRSLRINVKHLNLVDNLLCKNGSVLKKDACGEFQFCLLYV